MRLCHVVLSDRAYGAFNVVLSLARAQSRGEAVTVATNEDMAGVAEAQLREARVTVLALPISLAHGWPGGLGSISILRSARRAAKVLQEHCEGNGTDVVHFHLPNAYSVEASYRGEAPTVVTVHGPMYESSLTRVMGSFLSRRAFAKGDVVTVVNPDLLDYVRPDLGPKAPLLEIPNGVDAERVRALARSASLQGPWAERVAGARRSGSPVLCFVGRLEERKGPDILVRAVEELKRSHPGVQCVFVGEGPMDGQLKGSSKEMGLDQSVVFPGFVSNPYPAMDQSDVVLTNLSEELEGISLVHLEALALGKRVVTRFDAQKLKAFGDHVTLTTSEDPQALARAIQESLDRPSSRVAGVDLTPYSWESVSKQYDEAYRLAITRRRAAR